MVSPEKNCQWAWNNSILYLHRIQETCSLDEKCRARLDFSFPARLKLCRRAVDHGQARYEIRMEELGNMA